MNMDAPTLSGVDHVHVMVRDRAAAVAWYRDVLGFAVVPELAVWQADGGPLTLADAGGHVHLALFEHAPAPQHKSVVALGTDAAGFVRWLEHLTRALGHAPALEDHDLALSLYFRDPDGNPYEITTYDVTSARAALPAAH
jgi:catechol 2,3-dioxygenase-like lactoylglutathione lyase family enzyme